jgi:hypothetical protein
LRIDLRGLILILLGVAPLLCIGEAGVDVLEGGEGADALDGGADGDSLTGGSGARVTQARRRGSTWRLVT